MDTTRTKGQKDEEGVKRGQKKEANCWELAYVVFFLYLFLVHTMVRSSTTPTAMMPKGMRLLSNEGSPSPASWMLSRSIDLVLNLNHFAIDWFGCFFIITRLNLNFNKI